MRGDPRKSKKDKLLGSRGLKINPILQRCEINPDDAPPSMVAQDRRRRAATAATYLQGNAARRVESPREVYVEIVPVLVRRHARPPVEAVPGLTCLPVVLGDPKGREHSALRSDDGFCVRSLRVIHVVRRPNRIFVFQHAAPSR